MTLYLVVSMDKYELPLAVAGSVHELAEMIGVKENTIYEGLRRCKTGRTKKTKYMRLDIDDEI